MRKNSKGRSGGKPAKNLGSGVQPKMRAMKKAKTKGRGKRSMGGRY